MAATSASRKSAQDEVHVVKVTAWHYLAWSGDERPETPYSVMWAGLEWVCSCPDWHFKCARPQEQDGLRRVHECKHITEVGKHRAGERYADGLVSPSAPIRVVASVVSYPCSCQYCHCDDTANEGGTYCDYCTNAGHARKHQREQRSLQRQYNAAKRAEVAESLQQPSEPTAPVAEPEHGAHEDATDEPGGPVSLAFREGQLVTFLDVRGLPRHATFVRPMLHSDMVLVEYGGQKTAIRPESIVA